MAKYNFFISYSLRDGNEYASEITELLKQRGYTVWSGIANLTPGSTWAASVDDAISNCDCFLPVITESYLSSKWVRNELFAALSTSKERAKKILPFFFTDKPLPPEIMLHLSQHHGIHINHAEELPLAIDKIDEALGYDLKLDILYEKLTEYSKLKDDYKEVDTICRIIDLLCLQHNNSPKTTTLETLSFYKELYRLYTRLQKYGWAYSAEDKKIIRTIMDALTKVSGIINNISMDDSISLFSCSFAIHMLFLEREIRSECIDVWTSGDVRNPCPIEQYQKMQERFVTTFYDTYNEEALNSNPDYLPEDIKFIEETANYIFDRENTFTIPKNKKEMPSSDPSMSEDEEILLSIAKFIQEGNNLFDKLQQHGAAGDFLKCLLTSYERLKKYCEIVGATKIASDCVDKIVEIRGKVDKQEVLGNGNKKAENGIKSLLGLTIQNSGSYDVFISFKNEDSDLAETIYKFCHRHMKVPFWSKKTLPELSKSEYEDAIYDALRNSKHFVVVLSKLEYLNANWIKREMAAFDRAITEGRKTDANFVFVVTDDVYASIINSNKMCLDERYCGYQIIKISEYEKTLLEYLR